MLVEVLGLPKYTRSFVLRCEVDQAVSVECEYYPSFDARSLEVVLAQFSLVRREPPAPQPFDFDAWLKDRNAKAHAALNARLAQLSRLDAQKAKAR